VAIFLVQGPPGNGKSAYGARAIARALGAGRPVVSNIELRDDFGEFVAKHTAGLSRAKRRRRADQVRRSYFFSRDVDELLNVRLRGRGEGRGLAVLDEAATWLDARKWNQDNRGDVNDWLRKHRHRGFDVLLLVQHIEMLDKQVRHLPEVVIAMRNAKRFRRAGIPIVPFNFFLAVHCWHAHGRNQVVVLRKEAFRLGWWKDLYDTHGEAGTVEGADDDGHLWLPRPAAEDDGRPEGVQEDDAAPEPRRQAVLEVDAPADAGGVRGVPGSEPFSPADEIDPVTVALQAAARHSATAPLNESRSWHPAPPLTPRSVRAAAQAPEAVPLLSPNAEKPGGHRASPADLCDAAHGLLRQE
jgi:zona occludens toxin